MEDRPIKALFIIHEFWLQDGWRDRRQITSALHQAINLSSRLCQWAPHLSRDVLGDLIAMTLEVTQRLLKDPTSFFHGDGTPRDLPFMQGSDLRFGIGRLEGSEWFASERVDSHRFAKLSSRMVSASSISSREMVSGGVNVRIDPMVILKLNPRDSES